MTIKYFKVGGEAGVRYVRKHTSLLGMGKAIGEAGYLSSFQVVIGPFRR